MIPPAFFDIKSIRIDGVDIGAFCPVAVIEDLMNDNGARGITLIVQFYHFPHTGKYRVCGIMDRDILRCSAADVVTEP